MSKSIIVTSPQINKRNLKVLKANVAKYKRRCCKSSPQIRNLRRLIWSEVWNELISINPDDGSKSCPANQTKAEYRWRRNDKRWSKRIPNYLIQDHFDSCRTLYYQGNPFKNETLVSIDIDCNHVGTHEDVIRLAKYLQTSYFPDLVWSASSKGKGVHCYLRFLKCEMPNSRCNDMYAKLQRWLQPLLNHFMVDECAIKGTLPVINMYDGNVLDVTFGTPAIMPRVDVEHTQSISYHEVEELIATPIKLPETTVDNPATEREGSTEDWFSDDDISDLDHYERIGRLLVPTIIGNKVYRHIVTAKKVGQALKLLKLCSEKPCKDGALPSARIKALGIKLGHRTGEGFDYSVFKVIRDKLSSLGWISWESNQYWVGVQDRDGNIRKGIACKYGLAQVLIDEINMDLELGGGSSFALESPCLPHCMPKFMGSILDWDKQRLWTADWLIDEVIGRQAA